jgi:hypothetical protein
MQMYPIMATGIRAYCSHLIVDPKETDTGYFMSICGYQATVKGIIASFLENYGIRIELATGDRYLMRADVGYKVQLKRLPSARAHAILYPVLALPRNTEAEQNRFFIFTDKKAEEKALFFRHLDEKVDIPLHPSWTKWLWGLFENQDGWLTRLETLVGDCQGFAFRFLPKQLQDLISEAFRNRVPEIMNCMKWKGDDHYDNCNIA